MNPTETKTRYIRIAPFVIALFCFVLPFIQISCNGRKMISLTGIQLVTGTKIQPDNVFGEAFSNLGQEQQKVDSEPTIVLTLVCAAAGLALCFVPGKPGKLLPAIAGAAGFVCLLIAKSRFDSDIAKQGQGILTVDYVTGFMLACLSLLAGSGLCAFQLKQTGASQSAAQPLPPGRSPGFGVPPPPPPQPGEVAGAWTPPAPPPSPQPAGTGSWSPPPAPNPVMAPAPLPRAPRQPMSRSTKLTLAGALGIAALSAIGYWTYNYLNRAPSKAQISQVLEEQLKKRGQHLVDVSTKLISSSGGDSQGLDLAGQWSGTGNDGTSVTYVFRRDGSVTWMVNDFTFRASYPSGLQARYSLHKAGSIWQIDIQDFQDASFSTIVIQGILQPISDGKFKMDARPSNQATRPETFTPDAVIFTRSGTGPASNGEGSAPAATGSSGKTALLDFTAITELTEPYYVPIPADQYMQQQGVDPSVFRKIRSLLIGPGANRIRELAGISGQVEDLQGKLILKAATPKGHQCTYSGKIQAVRNGKDWQLTILSGAVDKDAPVGNKLSLYRGDIYASDQPDQVQKINDIISTATNDLQKLEQAQQQYRAEVTAAHALAANPASAISKTWVECEGTHCGQWIWNESAQDFDATWSGGAKAIIKIKQFDGNKVLLTRVDQVGVSAGLTATYEGTVVGDKAEGTVTWFWQIFEGGQAHGTWKATIQK